MTCNVLFVCDDGVSGKLVERILAEKRNDTVRSVSPRQALNTAEQDPPDLILVEFTIAEIGSFELFEMFRAVPSLQNIPVLFWRVPAPRRVYQRAQQAGIAGCIALVVAPEELVTARDAALRGDCYYPPLPERTYRPVGRVIAGQHNADQTSGHQSRRASALKRLKWILIAVTAVGILIPVCLCCSFLGQGAFPHRLVSPSTRRIAKRYLAAVTGGDIEGAVELAGANEGCRAVMREDAERDIALLGGAQVREVRMWVAWSTGSREEGEFANMEFEYRTSEDSEWQVGKIRLMTDYESWPANEWPPGERYACGNLVYHGP